MSYLLFIRHQFLSKLYIFLLKANKRKIDIVYPGDVVEWVDGNNMLRIYSTVILLTTCKGDFLWRRQRKLIILNGHNSPSGYRKCYKNIDTSDKIKHIYITYETWEGNSLCVIGLGLM